MIQVQDTSYRYPDETEALRSLRFHLLPGEMTLLCGPNGSGKSTLAKLLCALLAPTEGRITVGGVDTRRESRRVRQRVGLVFQNPDTQIIGETVREDVAFGLENLGMARAEIEARTEAILQVVGLSSVADKGCHALSGGEKRRLALASTLVLEPSVVIFDEPFTHLDWAGSLDLLRTLHELKREGRTVIIATHDVEKVVGDVDRVLILEKGRLLFDGSPRESLPHMPRAGIRPPCSYLLGQGLKAWASM